MIKTIRILILFLIFLNIPTFISTLFDNNSGGVFSNLLFFLIIVYWIWNSNKNFNFSFVLLGVLYFFLAGFGNYNIFFFPTAIKYFIFVSIGYPLIRDTTYVELFYFFLLGALTLFVEVFLFQISLSGRYSGVFLNPNAAGFILIFGYILSLLINCKIVKVLGQLVFVSAGFLTFSRTFLIILIFVNIISVFVNYRNLYQLVIGIFLFSVVLSQSDIIQLDKNRVSSFSSLLNGEFSKDLNQDSRTETWAKYYSKIFENPILGNGFSTFAGDLTNLGPAEYREQGVHNAFLLVLGESGIIVFIYFILLYVEINFKSLFMFKQNRVYFLLSISLILFLLTSHNYFDNFQILFLTIWLNYNVVNKVDNSFKKII